MPALVAAAVASAATLAGCGSGSRASLTARGGTVAASRCSSARSTGHLKLVLGNTRVTPRVVGSKGATVEVVSSFDGGQMSFPTPTVHPNAVCEISRHRSRDGTATVLYKALRRATVLFFSNYAHPSNAMDPAMFGRLVVR